jgi:hypothetical protein
VVARRPLRDPLRVRSRGVAGPRIGPAAGLLPVVVAHYFVFCNVMRLRPWREAVWALVMVWNTAVWVLGAGVLHWLPITLTVIPTTIMLIAGEVTGAGYRGVGASRGPAS